MGEGLQGIGISNRPLRVAKFLDKRSCLMKVKPLADKILVRVIEEKKAKKGGIVIPDTAKEKPQEGEVIAVGPGKIDENGKRVHMELKKGDHILMGKYAGTEVKIEGEEYLIMREEDVLAILGK
jgi:chaperonin GroES